MPVRFPTSSTSTCFSNWPSGYYASYTTGTITGLTSGYIWTAGSGSTTNGPISFILNLNPATQTAAKFSRSSYDPRFFIGESVVLSGFPVVSGKSVNGTFSVYNVDSTYFWIQCSTSSQITNNFVYNYSSNETNINDKSWIYSTANNSWNSLNVPIGTIMPYAGFSAPNGWLICDGSEISTTTYAALYNFLTLTVTGYASASLNYISNVSSLSYLGVGMSIVGTGIPSNTTITGFGTSTSTGNFIQFSPLLNSTGTYTYKIFPHGQGSSSSVFKIPDLRSRNVIGAKGNGILAGTGDKVLGSKSGSENITLSVGELPSHTHSITESPHSHGSKNTENETGLHYHPSYLQVTYQDYGGTYGYGALPYPPYGAFLGRLIVTGNAWDWPGFQPDLYNPYGSDIADPHTHSFTTNNSKINTTATSNYSNNTGGGLSHNNMQPYIPVNYIIKY